MGSPLKQRASCNKRKGSRTPAQTYLSRQRQAELNAIDRPLCSVCGVRRLVRVEDKRAGKCLECSLKGRRREYGCVGCATVDSGLFFLDEVVHDKGCIQY